MENVMKKLIILSLVFINFVVFCSKDDRLSIFNPENIISEVESTFVNDDALEDVIPQVINIELSQEDIDSDLRGAISTNNLNLVYMLLSNFGANPNAQDESGETALMVASEAGYLDIVNLLLQNGANPNLQDNNNDTALI